MNENFLALMKDFQPQTQEALYIACNTNTKKTAEILITKYDIYRTLFFFVLWAGFYEEMLLFDPNHLL